MTEIEWRVVAAVHAAQSVTLDELLLKLEFLGFAAVLSAVDRLSRRGVLMLSRVGTDYGVRVASPRPGLSGVLLSGPDPDRDRLASTIPVSFHGSSPMRPDALLAAAP